MRRMRRRTGWVAAALLTASLAFGPTMQAAGTNNYNNGANPNPYVESFEGFSNGCPVIPNVPGWSGDASAITAVVTNHGSGSYYSYNFTNAPLGNSVTHSNVLFVDGAVTNTLAGPTSTVVYLDCMGQFVYVTDTNAMAVDPLAQGTFYVNTNGHLVVRSADGWAEMTDPSIASDAWVRVTVTIDHAHTDAAANSYFQICLNGALLTNALGYNQNTGAPTHPGTWFKNCNAALSDVSLYSVSGRGYIDDLKVTTNSRAFLLRTLTYTAGAHGSISGMTPQTVADYGSGGSGAAVTAVPDSGYHFAQWSDLSTENPRTDSNVTSDLSVTASFGINTYTLTYAAGAHGSISGTSSQNVAYGGSGAAVTAVSDTGYHFTQWSDLSTANPRTDTNVANNVSVTASFATNGSYTLIYAAGPNGSISGSSSQAVVYGNSGTPVIAVPNAGYHFVQWSDLSTANPRTDTNVTGNISVTAYFTTNIYTLVYAAGANGSISGTSPQTVAYGVSGTPVMAVPNTGYHFVQWSDLSTANPRSDSNAGVNVTAIFLSGTYTLPEVDQTFCGRYVDRVLLGLNNLRSFNYHNGLLTGGMASTSFGMSETGQVVSWDFTAQTNGLHVLVITCNIFSDLRVATPSYQNAAGAWVQLPQMPYRDPWTANTNRYFLIDIPAGVRRYKVDFTGVYGNAFYILGAQLYQDTNSLPDSFAPLIIDYIDTQPTDRSCNFAWLSDEGAAVDLRYGRTPAVSEGVVSSAAFLTGHALTATGLLAHTNYYFTITQRDALGNTATYGPYNVTTTAYLFPITNTHCNAQTTNAATVLWQTGMAADSQVNYGTTPALGQRQSDATLSTDHLLIVTGLTANTLYYFSVKSHDASGNPSVDDNGGSLYRFRTCAPGAETLVIEIAGDGVDNDGNGLVDGADPGAVSVDTNLGDGYAASWMVGRLLDKVDFGYRHWFVASGDPVACTNALDNSFGGHNGTHNGATPAEVSFGDTTEFDLTAGQPGYYVLSALCWWRSDSALSYTNYDGLGWHVLPAPTSSVAVANQLFLIHLTGTKARFRLQGGYQFHTQLYRVKSDPFAQIASNTHPRLFFTAGEVAALKAKIDRVDVLGNSTDSYRYYLLNGWGSAAAYLTSDYSAWTSVVDSRDFANGLSYLGLAYVLTGDANYCNKLIGMLLLASSWPSGWGRDGSILKNGEMLGGVAQGYDWAWERMTPYQRDVVRRAIDRECQHLWLKSINSEHYGDGEYWWACEKANNWQAVAHGGLGTAALAILGESKDADQYVDQAKEQCVLFMDTNYDRDGVNEECYGYDGYAGQYLCLFLATLKKVSGVNLFHEHNDVLGKSLRWHLYGLEPSRRRMNAFDDGREIGLGTTPHLLKLASEFRDSIAMWHWDYRDGASRNKSVNGFLNEGSSTFLVPLSLLWYDDTLPLVSPTGQLPLGKIWSDFGQVVCQTGFENSKDIQFFMECGIGDGHGGHRDQSSFFFNAYGERLVDEGAIYSFGDAVYHNLVLIDGKGQGIPTVFFPPARASIPMFLNSGAADLIRADCGPAFGYQSYNPVSAAKRCVFFVRPVSVTNNAYVVLLDDVNKGDGQPHTNEFLLHAAAGFTVQALGNDAFCFAGTNAALNVRFATPTGAVYTIEMQNAVPLLRVHSATNATRGQFVSLLYPTDATHAMPSVRRIGDAQTSGFELAGDAIVYNASRGLVTGHGAECDGELFLIRSNAATSFAAVMDGTRLAWSNAPYLAAASNRVSFVLTPTGNGSGCRLTFGADAALPPGPVRVTLGGLRPARPYRRVDNGVDQGPFVASAQGTYAFNQDLTIQHEVTIAPAGAMLIIVR